MQVDVSIQVGEFEQQNGVTYGASIFVHTGHFDGDVSDRCALVTIGDHATKARIRWEATYAAEQLLGLMTRVLGHEIRTLRFEPMYTRDENKEEVQKLLQAMERELSKFKPKVTEAA